MSAVVLISATGCFGPSQEAQARLAQTKAEGDQLIAKFDGLEDRFIGNQANVKFYGQLAERHSQVSQVACGNNEYHFNAMVEHMERQEEKARLLKRNHLAEGEGVGRELARLASASASKRTKKQSHDD
ncbi:MAG: hypothetical protein ACJ790_14130 [Myxococcaceae bacterium]